MKIKILKENMFSDSRDWKSIDDFEQWNLSQVKALAKYRKGEGKFDYDFYEKVYADLKNLAFFLDGKCRKMEALDNHYWWRDKLKDIKYADEVLYGQAALTEMSWRHGVQFFLHQEKLDNKKLSNLLKLKVSASKLGDRVKGFGTKVIVEYLVCSKLQKPDKERLKDALKNMERLRKTYPFKLKHLPTFTRMAGLEETQKKGVKNKIETKVVKNNDDGYKSIISVELGDEIIYQVLTIKPVGTGLYGGSKGEGDIKRCYPRSLSKYPQEIQQLEPWEINGNPLQLLYRTAPTILTYDINFEILSIKPLDDKEERNVDPYSDNIFGKDKMTALSFFREVMKQVGEYIKNNPWYIYSFFGIETDEEMGELTFDEDHVNKRTKIYLMALRRLQRQLPGEWVVTYPEKGNANSIIFFKCPMSGINEVSSVSGGAIQGFGAPFTKEEEKLIQEMYSSAAIMGSGSGRIPAERSPEAHEKYVRMRHEKQGLQNFKRNRYFKEGTIKKPKIKIKIRRNLGERCQKGYKTHPTRKTKKMFGKTYRNCVKAEGKDSVSKEISKLMKKKGMKQDQAVAIALSMKEKGKLKETDPKKGTGKKPEESPRRLYTDGDPSDTVSVKFSTVQDIKDTFSKASFKSKSHERQSQIINLVHQRVRAAYQNAKDPDVKKRLKKAFDYAKKRKEASKEKTQSMKKDK